MNRQTLSSTERAEIQEIEQSLKTSTYLNNPEFWENIHQGIPSQQNVPNYKQATKGEVLGSLASESDGMHMDFSGLYDTATGVVVPETKSASENVVPRKTQHPSLTVSRNQAMAIKKYPALIEFLGRDEGTKIASNISEHLNVYIAEKVEANTREAHPDAVECKIDKQNFKQYFQGEDWICRVTASGPFKGDEAIYYSRAKDTACILRRIVVSKTASKTESGEEIIKEQIRYDDISADFNIIYEAGQTEVQLNEEQEVTASVEGVAVEEKENDTKDNGAEIERTEVAEGIGA